MLLFLKWGLKGLKSSLCTNEKNNLWEHLHSEELLDSPTEKNKDLWIIQFKPLKVKMHEHMELLCWSQRGWEMIHLFIDVLMKSGFSQMRPGRGFTLFRRTLIHCCTIHPAACCSACHFTPYRGESEMESRTMNSSLTERTCDQSTSQEPFSVCVVTSLRMVG